MHFFTQSEYDALVARYPRWMADVFISAMKLSWGTWGCKGEGVWVSGTYGQYGQQNQLRACREYLDQIK